METWKTLKENPKYEISNKGNFRNSRGKILRLNKNKKGYLYCNVSKNNVITKVKIHILVARYFVDNPYNKETVNHIDGNKLNNDSTNLEWLTLKENIQHAWRTGLCKPKKSKICNF
jgi:hypothetical protein